MECEKLARQYTHYVNSVCKYEHSYIWVILLPSQKVRQVIVMHYRFCVGMYVCISADCAMLFYACVCISAMLAQYNSMLVYVCLSRFAQLSGQNVPLGTITAPDYCLACVARFLWKNTTTSVSSPGLPRSLRMAYNFRNDLKIYLNVYRVCYPLNKQGRGREEWREETR